VITHHMTGGELVMLGSAAGAALALVHAIRAAAKGAWTWAKRVLRGPVLRQCAEDAKITPALASTGRYADLFSPAPEPTSPPPAWATTSDPSPADLTVFDQPPAPDWVRVRDRKGAQ
jgi:hypothetical protein